MTQTEIGELPTTWRVTPAGEYLSEAQYGLSAKGGETGRCPILRMTNQAKGRISTKKLQYVDIGDQELERFRLQRGDILFNRTNSFELVGRTALFDIDGDYVFASYLIRLRTIAEELDPRYLNFYLNAEENQRRLKLIATRGVSQSNISATRLKSFLIVVPPLKEQRNIAKVLNLLQRATDLQEDLLRISLELKQSLMRNLLTKGSRGELLKDTEIGPIPRSWDLLPLSAAVDAIDYGISAPIPKSAPEDSVKIVSTADITRDGRLLYDQIRRINAPVKTVSRLSLNSGDVLFNWRNSSELIGKTAVFQTQSEPHVFASFILRIRCDERKTHNHFLAYLMNYWREKGVFIQLARRAVNQANYNHNEISVLKIPLPSYEEQKKIAESIAAVDRKIEVHRRKQALLSSTFQTLLHQLTTARIRVNDLDLSEIEKLAA